MKSNKDYRGQFDKPLIEELLSNTRLTYANKIEMIRDFVEGVRIKDLDISASRSQVKPAGTRPAQSRAPSFRAF